MGKGLVPADFDTWKLRRKGEEVVTSVFRLFNSSSHWVPNGFWARINYSFWELFVNSSFASCKLSVKLVELLCWNNNLICCAKLFFCSLQIRVSIVTTSDFIGLGVFNYDFGSVTKESPVIKVWWKCYHNFASFSCILNLLSFIFISCC